VFFLIMLSFVNRPQSLFRWGASMGLVVGSGVGTYFFTKKLFATEKSVALDANQFKSFKLEEIYPISHNTRRYRFGLSEDQELGLPVASCLVVKAPIGEDGKDEIRPYTPVSDPNDTGFFDLIIKEYPKGVMSKHIASLQPGDSLLFKGPFPKIPYSANMKKKIGMVAGGTGITPMLQVLTQILKNPDDKTEVSLVFCNLSESDILLKMELDTYARRHKNFKVYYVVDKPSSKNWTGGVGFITDEILKSHLPPPSADNQIFVCGPPGLMKHVSGDKAPDYTQGELSGLLKKLGYSESNVFKF